MARLPNIATKEERREVHVAKVAGKVIDRARRAPFTPSFRSRAEVSRYYGTGSIAIVNRHTGKPHENAREIMRRTMSPLERRAFAAKVAEQLAAPKRSRKKVAA